MIEYLKFFHPLIIEGVGGYDSRDPKSVSTHILDDLQKYWFKFPPSKSIILVTQGDPYEERGISAITRLVCDGLDIPRALIFLDPDIADYHWPLADRHKLKFEISYSSMSSWLETRTPDVVSKISSQVSATLAQKNAQRLQETKTTLPKYYFDFVMLQEVTKIACKQICGEVTIAHTSREISPFSITSFYEVGLGLGLICEKDMVPYYD